MKLWRYVQEAFWPEFDGLEKALKDGYLLTVEKPKQFRSTGAQATLSRILTRHPDHRAAAVEPGKPILQPTVHEALYAAAENYNGVVRRRSSPIEFLEQLVSHGNRLEAYCLNKHVVTELVIPTMSTPLPPFRFHTGSFGFSYHAYRHIEADKWIEYFDTIKAR